MRQRIISGAVLVLFCAAVIFFINETFSFGLNIVAGLISMLSVYELIKALGLLTKWFLSVPALATALAVPLMWGRDTDLVYYAFVVAIFGSLIVYHQEVSFREAGVLMCTAVLIPAALKTLVLIRDMNPDYAAYYILLAVFVAWIADASAYFAGMLFGKHKLCPEISPKKTVEGFIGGWVVTVILIMLSGVFVSHVTYGGQVQVNYFSLFLIGFLGAPISVLGDLSFSLVKRSCHIKDFGQVIPGHGGILDRFDSVIFTAPFVYLMVHYLPLLTAVSGTGVAP